MQIHSLSIIEFALFICFICTLALFFTKSLKLLKRCYRLFQQFGISSAITTDGEYVVYLYVCVPVHVCVKFVYFS